MKPSKQPDGAPAPAFGPEDLYKAQSALEMELRQFNAAGGRPPESALWRSVLTIMRDNPMGFYALRKFILDLAHEHLCAPAKHVHAATGDLQTLGRITLFEAGWGQALLDLYDRLSLRRIQARIDALERPQVDVKLEA